MAGIKRFHQVTLAVAMLSLASIMAFYLLNSNSDQIELRQLQTNMRMVPDLSYPTKDIQGRRIPEFNKLAVLPECNSCSTFRKNCLVVAKANPQLNYLVLAPTSEQLEDFHRLTNCYVAIMPKSPEFGRLIPGMYNR